MWGVLVAGRQEVLGNLPVGSEGACICAVSLGPGSGEGRTEPCVPGGVMKPGLGSEDGKKHEPLLSSPVHTGGSSGSPAMVQGFPRLPTGKGAF